MGLKLKKHHRFTYVLSFCFISWGRISTNNLILLVLAFNVVRKSYQNISKKKSCEFHVEKKLYINVFKNIKFEYLCTIFYDLHSFLKIYFKENNLRIAH